MYTIGFICLLVVSTVCGVPVEKSESVNLGEQPAATRLVKLLRDRRSPVPDPHHLRNKIHGHFHVHGHFSEPDYVAAAPVVQPVYVKPVVQPVYVKPVVQPVAVKPVYQPVAVKPVYQPVETGCNVCGGGGGGGGGYGGSHSQASSQASSSSFAAGLNSPFGNLGFSSSSAQSSAQAGSAGYGK